MGGTVLSQLVPLLFSPFLARMYSPEQFGNLSNILTIVVFFATMFMLRLETAIVLSSSTGQARYVSSLCFALSLGASIVVMLKILLIEFLFKKSYLNYSFYIPPLLLFYCIFQIQYYSMLSVKSYKSIALSKIGLALVIVFMQIVFNSFGAGLLIALTLSYFIVVAFINSKIEIVGFAKLIDNLRRHKSKVAYQIYRHKNIPFYTAPASLLDSGKNMSINLAITSLFGIALFGQYTLAMRVIQAPIQLFNGVVGQYFFSQISNASPQAIYTWSLKVIFILSMLAAPPFLMLYYFVSDLFVLIFGQNWKIAGDIAKEILLWLYFNCISSPISMVYIVIGKQRIAFVFSIISFIIPMIFLFGLNGDILTVVSNLSNAMSIYLAFYIAFTIHVIKNFCNESCANHTELV